MRDRPNDDHRKVAQAAIGRALLPSEVVDHRDENKANNTTANLRVMDRAAHTAEHNRTRGGLSRLRKSLSMVDRGEKLY